MARRVRHDGRAVLVTRRRDTFRPVCYTITTSVRIKATPENALRVVINEYRNPNVVSGAEQPTIGRYAAYKNKIAKLHYTLVASLRMKTRKQPPRARGKLSRELKVIKHVLKQNEKNTSCTAYPSNGIPIKAFISVQTSEQQRM